ncbi:hypothetical protein HY008_01800 [Candidatus Woesebacteria bacterium]|nr:hypothetical protein [Candidatus Woesebacteria bacterium]
MQSQEKIMNILGLRNFLSRLHEQPKSFAKGGQNDCSKQVVIGFDCGCFGPWGLGGSSPSDSVAEGGVCTTGAGRGGRCRLEFATITGCKHLVFPEAP